MIAKNSNLFPWNNLKYIFFEIQILYAKSLLCSIILEISKVNMIQNAQKKEKEGSDPHWDKEK